MNLDKLTKIIKDEEIVILYIKSRSCSVCTELLPKVGGAAESEKIKFIDIYIEDNREIGSKYNVFTAPTIIMFVMGKEVYREGRFLRVSELKDKIYKYKELLL
ncbi:MULTISPECIES: thioredoxin family protein [Psychrilyobacter]|uniref:Thioredoxin n=1 Tax=Psychrilyobacter piezotolerans TaxID=2293438 RepID=A0ABX9KK74_9FUSO|nr:MULTISPECIES: thioredoxin family protein [Psychrilyobacter]MCS5421081.1 thioredoxin family protein [Psychrilyobacter sp. S5]NDI76774.1 thioredoxin family protein [Psychrilyobacter piezotolerans]RDE65058.1 thioredoxin [Psychrilyobacter sp. S5]REI42628.1 thioredoxin [Psychrilyobacter piezotolerans]